jgi:hypothetical protein
VARAVTAAGHIDIEAVARVHRERDAAVTRPGRLALNRTALGGERFGAAAIRRRREDAIEEHDGEPLAIGGPGRLAQSACAARLSDVRRQPGLGMKRERDEGEESGGRERPAHAPPAIVPTARTM